MADEDQRHAVGLHQPVDQRDDLGLHDRVERAGRLVGDQQFRAGGDRRGNGDALALAAGKLVRIGAQRSAPGSGSCTRCDQLDAPWRRRAAVRAPRCACDHLGDLRADRMTGSRLAPGSWKTKPMSRAADRRAAEARPCDLPADQRVARQQPGDRQRQRALARTALADHRQPLAVGEVEARCRRARRHRCRA